MHPWIIWSWKCSNKFLLLKALRPAHNKILTFVSVISCSVEANPSASVILQHQLTKPNHAGISTSNGGAAFINTSIDGALAHHWKVTMPGKQLISPIVMLVVIRKKIIFVSSTSLL
jgi:hypothetical protein